MVAITVATNVTVRTGAQGIPGIPGTAAPHAVDHEAGGTDEVTIEDLITAGTIGQVPTATASNTMVMSSAVPTHLADTSNPHSVTAAQASAEPAGAIATHTALADAHHPQVHTILSHDTDTTGAELTRLADGSDVDSLHIHAIADAHIADTTAHTGLLDLAATRAMTGSIDVDGNDIIGAIPLGGTLTEVGIVDYLDEVGSVGFFGDPAGLIVDNGDDFDVAAGTGAFHTTASATSPLGIGDWPAAATNAIPLNSVRYVGVEWNSGTPQVVVKTTNVWTLIQEWPLGTVTRDNNGVLATPIPIRLSNFASLIDQRISETEPFLRANGLNLGNSSLTVQRTSGRGWFVTTPQDFVLFDSNASDTFDRYFQDSGSGFNVQLNQTSFEDQSFENGSGTLGVLTNNRFGVRWWYIDLQTGDLSMMYGTSNTNDIAVALREEPPADLPPRLQVGNILLGRYVFVKSGGVAIDVSDIWGTTFSRGGGGDGDVRGPAGGVVATEFPVYVDTTGKAIGGSGILSTDVELTANKGAVSGYASLDASQIVVEPAQVLRTTTGPTSLTIGAIANGEVLVRSGTTIVGSAAAAGNVTSPGSETAGRITKFTGSNAIDETATTEAELATAVTHSGIVTGNPHALDAADVSAEPSGSIATHAALADVHHAEIHAATHSDGGSDEIVVENLATAGTVGQVPVSDGAGALAMSNDVIRNATTGLVDNLSAILSINGGDNTKVDVAASQGIVVDFDPDPNNPNYVPLVWAVPFTAIELPDIETTDSTMIFVVDGGGGVPTIELSSTFPSNEDLQTKLLIGTAIHVGGVGTVVQQVINGGVAAYGVGATVLSLLAAFGDFNLRGNVYSANGANLLLDKSDGVIWGRGANNTVINDQHTLVTDTQLAIGLYVHSHRDGSGGFTNTFKIAVDPTLYDDGSGTPASSGSSFQIMRLSFEPRSGLTAVELGQTLYPNLAQAIDGIAENGVVKNPVIQEAIFRGWLVVQGTATELDDTADAVFREVLDETSQPSGAGTDVNAIHVNASNEISGITVKSTVVAGDLLVIEDSAAGFIKKSVPFSSLDDRYAELAGPTFAGLVEIENSAPQLSLDETDAGADERDWRLRSIAGDISLTTFTDAGAAGNNAITWARTGTTVDLCTISSALTVTGEASAATPTVGGSLTTKDYVDSLVQGVAWQDPVLDRDLTVPPVSPTAGDRYLPAAGSTGAWSTHDDEPTEWDGTVWGFVVPIDGMTIPVIDEDLNLRYNGSAWVFFGSTVSHPNLANLTSGDGGHTQLQLRSEKGSASGYVGLTASSKITSGAFQVYGTAVDTACVGNDARLSDARTPTAHTIVSHDTTATGANLTTLTDGSDADSLHDHALADTHIADTTNPHGTDIENLGSGTLAELNAAVTDATLDTSSASRPPTSHASDHSDGGSDEITIENLAATSTDTDSVLKPDGSGGVEFVVQEHVQTFTMQGPILVDQVASQNFRFPFAATIKAIIATGNEAVATGTYTFRVQSGDHSAYVGGDLVGSVSLTALTASTTGLSFAAVVGDVTRVDCTAVGTQTSSDGESNVMIQIIYTRS